MIKAEFLNSHPEVLELWEEFRNVRDTFWTRIEALNKKYEHKYHIILITDVLGDVCGIEVKDLNDSIHAFHLENCSEDK